MAQASQFVISEFTNPSGEIIYRVAGWLDQATAAYLATKKQEHERGMLSECQLKDIRLRLEDLAEAFPGRALSTLSREALAAHCHRGNPKPKTFNNRRGILFTFFKFAFCQDWVAVNPLEKVPHLRIAHRRAPLRP